MKFNMDQTLLGFNGQEIKKSEEDPTPVSLGDALTMSCVNANPQKHADADEKMKIYRLLQRINGGGDVEFEAEDIVLLKTLVAEIYAPTMVGPIYDILENTAEH